MILSFLSPSGPRRPKWIVACATVLLLAGCAASDDDGSGNDSSDDRVPTPLADRELPPGDPSDEGDGGTDPVDEGDEPEIVEPGPDEDPDWYDYGTAGSFDGVTHSRGGHAMCSLADIRTDDLNNAASTEVPPDPWGSVPIPDDPARCGDDAETAIWRLTNCERLSRNLAPLNCDLRLVWVSRQHSLDMVARGYFDHDTPDGVTPWDRMDAHGIGFRWAGENIAIYPSIEGVHFGWMDSDGHRENKLNATFTHNGVGVVSGGGYMSTEEFIQP